MYTNTRETTGAIPVAISTTPPMIPSFWRLSLAEIDHHPPSRKRKRCTSVANKCRTNVPTHPPTRISTIYKSNTNVPTPLLTQLNIIPFFSSSNNPVPLCSTRPFLTPIRHVPQFPTSQLLATSKPALRRTSSNDSSPLTCSFLS